MPNGPPSISRSWMELETNDPDVTALVSDEDYERVSMFMWRVMNTGYISTGSVENRPNKTKRNDFKLLHRFVLGLPSGRVPEVDHINKIKHDCRRENLRIVTRAENMRNSHNYKDYAPKGVTIMPNGSWRAMVRHNNKLIHLGVFDLMEDAQSARRQWEEENWIPPMVSSDDT